MQEAEISQETLALALGCTRGAIGHYLAGRRNPTLIQLEIIAAELQLDPCWLVFGNGQVRETRSTYQVSDKKRCSLPVRGTTGEGSGITLPGKVEFVACSDDQAYALIVEGGQWAPRYYEGEIILVCPTKEPLPGDELWICYRDGSKDLLALVRVEKKRIILDSLTEQRKRQIRPLSDIESMHCVLGVLREGATSTDPE